MNKYMVLMGFYLPLFMLLVIAGFLLNLLCGYPGYMSNDSYVQFYQAISNQYDDHHPPIMAAFWHVLLIFGKSPAPMLVFHLLLYWGSIALLGLTYVKRHPRLIYLLPFWWCMPVVMGMSVVLWKDVGLAFSWLFVIVTLNYFYLNEKRISLIVSVFLSMLFLYGFCVRHNALTGALPIIFFAVTVQTPQSSAFKRISISAMLFLAALTFDKTLTNMLITQHTHMEQEIYLADLDCISRKEGRTVLPSYIRNNPHFSERIDYFFHFNGPILFVPKDSILYTQNPADLQELRDTWLSAIYYDAPDYIACRIAMFKNMLSIGQKYIYYPYHSSKQLLRPSSSLRFVANEASITTSRYLTILNQSWLNHPMLWLALQIMTIFYCMHDKCRQLRLPVYTLGISSLGYVAAYFLISLSWDLRYVYWPILSSQLACILVMLEIINNYKNQNVNFKKANLWLAYMKHKTIGKPWLKRL